MSQDTVLLRGLGASAGVEIGPAFVIDRRKLRTPKLRLEERELSDELERLGGALARSDSQLQSVKESVEGEEHALILEAHRLMLFDPAFAGEVRRLIRDERLNAEWAVRRTAKKLRAVFDQMEDEYFRERRQDVDFVADRVIRNLLGQSADLDRGDIPSGVILVAHDLSPSDAALLLQPEQVLGLVTELGGTTSHTAIVARARGLPAVVGAAKAAERARSGDLIAIDGERGLVVVRPDEQQLELFERARRRLARQDAELATERDLPARTLDDVPVRLNANIEFDEEVALAAAVGAEGIGLYRTEFLFLGRASQPDEEEHYQTYRRVLEAHRGRPVTIRTLDLGGDKMPVERRKDEANPALGLRAIRYCVRHPELFRPQLKALLRASVHGNLRIMFPMISGVTEVREARAVLESVRAELARAGEPVAEKIPIGVMIELPSAAQIADRLAKEVDFFSIGTNDLIQYSLAIDRQNRDVAYLYHPLHLAILRMLRFTVEAAHAEGIEVSICGEMAGDPHYTLVLLGLGVDELSMTAGSLPLVRRLVRSATAREGRELLEQAMTMSTAEEIERFVRTTVEARYGNLLAEPEGDDTVPGVATDG